MTFVDRFGCALGSVKYDVGDSAAAGRTHNPADAFVQSGFRWHHVCESLVATKWGRREVG